MPTSGYAAPHLAGLVGSPPGDRGHRDDGQHDGQPPSQHYHQHHQRQHDSAPNATQSQQEPEEGEHCNEQEDFLSHQMQQLLVKDLQSFWSNTVAPSTSSIAQKEAGLVQQAADGELQEVMNELERVHGVVHTFQQQISETLSLLQGR